MSQPLPDHDLNRPTISGDWHDDDAAVFESYLETAQDLPEPLKLPVAPTVTHVPVPGPATRTISATYTLDNTWSPVRALPDDRDRRQLVVVVISTTATDTIRFGSDPSHLSSRGGSAVLPVGVHRIPGHTGPVCFSAPDVSGSVTVSIMAVTV